MTVPNPAAAKVTCPPAGGKSSSNSHGLLANPLVARYLAFLVARPLLARCCTTGVLSFFQEVIANHIAGVKFRVPKDAPLHVRILAALKIDSRAAKMAIYGFFVSAPMSYLLNGLMLKLFAGRTSKKSKFAQLLTQNFVVAPINTFVFLASMSIIAGVRSSHEIRHRVRAGFGRMLALMWIVQPSALFVAQRFVPIELWVPFFSFITFSIGTYFTTKVKIVQVRLAELEERRKKGPDPDSCSGPLGGSVQLGGSYQLGGSSQLGGSGQFGGSSQLGGSGQFVGGSSELGGLGKIDVHTDYEVVRSTSYVVNRS